MVSLHFVPGRLGDQISNSRRISSLANIDKRLVVGLRAIQSGEWSYRNGTDLQPNAMAALSQDLGYPASWGDPNVLPAYGGRAATAAWKALGVTGRDGLGGVPCEIVHGTVTGGSCSTNIALRGLYAFLEAMAIYTPVRLFLPGNLTSSTTHHSVYRCISCPHFSPDHARYYTFPNSCEPSLA